MTSTPYTKAYTENLIDAMRRTRAELKLLLADMMTVPGVAHDLDAAEVYKMAEQMHRMVGSITDDLAG